MLFEELKKIIPVIETDSKQSVLNYLVRQHAGKDENGIENINLLTKTKYIQLETISKETNWMDAEFVNDLSLVNVDKEYISGVVLKQLENDITIGVIKKLKELGDKEYSDRICALQNIFINQNKNKLVKKYYKLVFWFYRTFLKKEKDVIFKLDIKKDNSLFLGMMTRVFNNMSGLGGTMFILTSKEKICELFENSERFQYNSFSGVITNHILIDEGILHPGIKVFSCPYLHKDSLIIGRLVDNHIRNPKLLLCYDKNSFGQDVIEDTRERKKKNRVYLDIGIANIDDTESNFLSLKIKTK